MATSRSGPMKRVAIIQARMNSTRLPGKVLAELDGEPMLVQQLRRIKRCRWIDEIVVATTTGDEDRPILAAAEREGVRWFRGSEHDVLSRYHGAAREAGAEVVVRLTSDCPLLDPEVTDRVVEALVTEPFACDYASNTVDRTYPRGLDTEAFFMDVLDRTVRLATSSAAKEHVTYFIHRERPDLFVLRTVVDAENHADLRWTVDTPEDLQLARAIYQTLGLSHSWKSYHDIVQAVRTTDALQQLNAHVIQKEV